MNLEKIVLEPQQNAQAAVVWLHGLGADGNDFVPIVPELNLGDLPIRFIFPHAPVIPVSINNHMRMRAWYDIGNVDLKRHVDSQKLRQSAAAVLAIIEEQIQNGIPSDKIMLAGFSQGGAVAYELALAAPIKLAGLLVLSSYLATADSVQKNAANAAIPILICHGSHDPVVPVELSALAHQQLCDWGYAPHLQKYPMEHAVCAEEIGAIADFIRHCVG